MLGLLSLAFAAPLHLVDVLQSGDVTWLVDADSETIIVERDGQRSPAGPLDGLVSFSAHDGALYALRSSSVLRLEDGRWTDWRTTDEVLHPPMVWREGEVWTARLPEMPQPIDMPYDQGARAAPMHWGWSSTRGQWGRRPLEAVGASSGLACTQDGTVWFVYQGRLSAWREGRWHAVDGPVLGFGAELLADGDALWVWSRYGEVRRFAEGRWTHHALPGRIDDVLVHDGSLYALQGARLVKVSPGATQQADLADEPWPRHLVVVAGEVAAVARDGQPVEAPTSWTPWTGEVLASAAEVRAAWYVPGGRAWMTDEDDTLRVLWVDRGEGPRVRAEVPWTAAVDRWSGRGAMVHRDDDTWRVSVLSLLDDRRPVMLPGVYRGVSGLRVLGEAVFVTHEQGITRVDAGLDVGSGALVAPVGHRFVAADDVQLITWHEQTLWHHSFGDDGAPKQIATGVRGATADGIVLAQTASGMQLFELDGTAGASLAAAEIWDILGRDVFSGACDGPRCPLTDVATGASAGVLVVPDPMDFAPNVGDGKEAMFWSGSTLMMEPYEGLTVP